MKLTIKVLFFIISNIAISQDKNFIIPDSLKNKDFQEIERGFYRSQPKSTEDSIYSNTYLKKAYLINDSINIAKGYLFLTSMIQNDEEIERLVDKSIQFSDRKTNFLVPCTAYSMKANICLEKKKFKEALTYFLLTNESATKGKNFGLKRITMYNIAVLKTTIGDYSDALRYLKEYWNSYSKEDQNDQHHLKTFFALSNAYTKNNLLDSASYYSNLGIKKSIEFDDEHQYYLFVFLEGLNKYYAKNYSTTIDSVQKALPYLIKYKEKNNLAVAYSYLGKSYVKLNNKEASIVCFKKVDSIFNQTGDLLPRCRDVYKIMIDYAKKDNNTKSQLYYTNQLLKLDSILGDNYKYLNSTIYNKYETPKLKEQKANLVKLHTAEKKELNKYLLFSILTALLISISLAYNYYKRKKYQIKYKQLINQLDNKSQNYTEIDKSNTKRIIDIDEVVVKKVLKNLVSFEKEKGYLQNKITLAILAKKVGTNTKYLSKILNTYKEKKYTDYINDLRINHIVSELRRNKKMRKYTIDVIAKEAGFNSRRSFSNVFLNKTGISASYFINELNSNNKTL